MLRLTAIIVFSLCCLATVSGSYKKCLVPYTEHDKRLQLEKKLAFYVKHYNHLAYVEIYCVEGYNLYDSQPRDFVSGNKFKTQCKDGEFYPPVPDKRFSCRLLDSVCKLKLTSFLIASPNKETFKRGEEVKFKCKSGYYLIGIDKTICLKNGVFLDKKLPSCAPYCQIPKQKYLDVKSSSKSIRVGGNIGLDCVDGYRLINGVEQTRYCQVDGKWDVEIENNLCKRLGCPEAPDFNDGTYKAETSSDESGSDGWFKVGATLKFKCYEKFYLKGKDYMICSRTGEFVFNIPKCTIIICDEPMIPKNGYISKGEKDEYEIGNKVKYECDFKYYLEGEDTATCKKRGVKNGIFSKAPECIEILCDKPMPIDEGTFLPEQDEYSIGDDVKYKCNTNYKLVGIEKAICEKKGEKTAEFSKAPSCESIVCDAPMPIDNGNFIDPKIKSPFTVGKVASYECKRGYEFATKFTTSTCELQNDKMSAKFSKTPVCKRVYCLFPGIPSKGTISPEQKQYAVDISVTFDCNKCYKLNGKKTSTCQQNGKFNNPLPKCDIITCSKKNIPYPSDSTFSPVKEVYNCGTSVTFKCHKAFKQYGDKKTTCLENGQWSIDERAVCDPITCDRPKLNLNVRVTPNYDEYPYLFEIRYYCKHGYSVVQDLVETTAVCQSEGKFSYPSITCKQITCGPPPVPEFGSVTPDTTKDEYVPGNYVEYECKKWYTLKFKKGTKTFNLCQNDGTWNDAPTCVAPSCEKRCYSKGDKEDKDKCQCDYKCYERKDCCHDRTDKCEKYSCANRCGKAIPDGGCSCDRICTITDDKSCCHDYIQACPGAWYIG